MAGSSNEDFAKALEALSAGAEETQEQSEAQAQPEPAPLETGEKPRKARPAAPAGFAGRPASPIEEPEAVPSPAPASSAGPRVPSAVLKLNEQAKQVEFKRTIIPLLLTMGVILPLGGIAAILLGEDSPFGEGIALPISMVVMGLLILAAAIVTMMQVRAALLQQGR